MLSSCPASLFYSVRFLTAKKCEKKRDFGGTFDQVFGDVFRTCKKTLKPSCNAACKRFLSAKKVRILVRKKARNFALCLYP